MTKTQFFTATSLDGFIATVDDSLDWLFALPEVDNGYAEFIADVGAIAMGSSTYEFVFEELQKQKGDTPDWPYAMPTWIFSSRRLPAIAGADLHFVSGDVRPVHDEMKETADEKNIWIAGGGDLVGQFHDAGLLDELILHIAPVTLGQGKPLLPREITAMNLLAVRERSPFVELRYAIERAG